MLRLDTKEAAGKLQREISPCACMDTVGRKDYIYNQNKLSQGLSYLSLPIDESASDIL